MVVDEVARHLSITAWKNKDGAMQARDAARDVLLVKPQSYMNASGVPLRIIASWYRTPPQDLLVVYDDMDLPFGTLRMRPFGGHGGHNGMRSIIATMTDGFPRLRVGVGRPKDESIDHVLSAFTSDERSVLPKVLGAAADGILRWLEVGTQDAMQYVNTLSLLES